jgi:hypothetical protein
MKVTGRGLSLPPTHFEVSVPPLPANFLGHTEKADSQDSKSYIMQDIEIPAMYKDYFCCLSADFETDSLKHFIYA